MNKQELQNKIEDLEKQLAELKEQVNYIEDEEIKKGVRQRPKIDEIYYFLNSLGNACHKIWLEEEQDLFRFNLGNCFKTEEEAKDYKENILTKQALKDLALELNNRVEICWNNGQNKYYIAYYGGKCLSILQTLSQKDIGQVYCLDENFLGIAKERIGEEKLIKLIKSGV